MPYLSQATHQWIVALDGAGYFDRHTEFIGTRYDDSPVISLNQWNGIPTKDDTGTYVGVNGKPFVVVHMNGDVMKKNAMEKHVLERFVKIDEWTNEPKVAAAIKKGTAGGK